MTFAFNRDCVEAIKQFPDNYFDLAVVDPPYGDGSSQAVDMVRESVNSVRSSVTRTGGGWAKKYGKKIIAWDFAPGQEYFDELFRVSRNQIIWGGNYFSLPPTRCFLIWEKTNVAPSMTFSQAEYAWTSFCSNAKIFKFSSSGQEFRFHPTQKPIELYQWIFSNYAKPGYRILDTHLGSGSSRIAAHNMGLEFYGYEIDEEYFQKQEERFAYYTRQVTFDI